MFSRKTKCSEVVARLSISLVFVTDGEAGTAMWNMGVAYLAGLILYYGLQRRWIKV